MLKGLKNCVKIIEKFLMKRQFKIFICVKIMNINILRLKYKTNFIVTKFLLDALTNYQQLLSKYCNLHIRFLLVI